MKTPLLVTALAASLLAGGYLTTTQAAPEHNMSQTEMVEMCKTMDTEGCRAMMREMVKNKALHKVMAEELSKDPTFNDTYKQQLKDGAHGGG